MIEDLCSVAVLLTVGYGVPALLTRYTTKTIACRCGALEARAVVIVDPCDEARLSEALSEGCPLCRIRDGATRDRPLSPRSAFRIPHSPEVPDAVT